MQEMGSPLSSNMGSSDWKIFENGMPVDHQFTYDFRLITSVTEPAFFVIFTSGFTCGCCLQTALADTAQQEGDKINMRQYILQYI